MNIVLDYNHTDTGIDFPFEAENVTLTFPKIQAAHPGTYSVELVLDVNGLVVNRKNYGHTFLTFQHRSPDNPVDDWSRKNYLYVGDWSISTDVRVYGVLVTESAKKKLLEWVASPHESGVSIGQYLWDTYHQQIWAMQDRDGAEAAMKFAHARIEEYQKKIDLMTTLYGNAEEWDSLTSRGYTLTRAIENIAAHNGYTLKSVTDESLVIKNSRTVILHMRVYKLVKDDKTIRIRDAFWRDDLVQTGLLHAGEDIPALVAKAWLELEQE